MSPWVIGGLCILVSITFNIKAPDITHGIWRAVSPIFFFKYIILNIPTLPWAANVLMVQHLSAYAFTKSAMLCDYWLRRKWCRVGIEELLHGFSRSSVKFLGQTVRKTTISTQIERFSYCDSSLNLQLVTKLEVAYRRCPIVFQGHLSNFEVIWASTTILNRIQRCRSVAPVWIHRWFRNDAQSLKWHRRGALIFFRSAIKIQVHGDQKLTIWLRF